MKTSREDAQQGRNLTLTAVALLEISAQTAINFAMAPIHSSGFLMAAKECVVGTWLLLAKGWRRFWSSTGPLRRLLRNFETIW